MLAKWQSPCELSLKLPSAAPLSQQNPTLEHLSALSAVILWWLCLVCTSELLLMTLSLKRRIPGACGERRSGGASVSCL